jgi:hypothetical protein
MQSAQDWPAQNAPGGLNSAWYHGIRLDDRQRAANIGEQPIKADEYQWVDAAEEKPFWSGPAAGH